MIRMGTIGIKSYGWYYLDFAERLKDQVKLECVVVRDPSEDPEVYSDLCAKGRKIHPAFEEMLAAHRHELDLIGLPVNIGAHCPYTCACVEAGVNVLVEKPAASTVEEVDRMIEARDRSGKFVAVGFQDIYNVNFQKAKRMILDGAIGKIKRSYVAGLWPRPDGYYERNQWAGKIRTGNDFVYDSPASNAMAHFLNLQLFMLGPAMDRSADPNEITGKLYKGRSNLENFDTCSLKMILDDGSEHFYTVSHACLQKKDPELLFEGEKGILRIGKTMLEMFDHAGNELFRTPDSYGDTGRYNMLPSVVANLKGDRQVYCSLEMARCHTKVINTIQKTLDIENIPESRIACSTSGENTFHYIVDLETKFINALENWKIMEL